MKKKTEFNLKDIPIRHDVNSEKAILGAMLIDTDCLFEGTENLKEDDFFDPKNQVIFKAFQFFKENPQTLDVSSLLAYLTERKLAEACGGLPALAELSLATVSTTSFPYLLKKLKNYSTARKLHKIASKLIFETNERFEEIENVVEEAQADLLALSEKSNAHKIESQADVMDRAIKRLQDFQENGIIPKSGILLGIDKIDEFTGGFHPCELSIIAARTSVGKSVASLQLARQAAKQTTVGVISLEMSNDELSLRNLASAGTPLNRLRMFDILKHEIPSIIENAKELKKLPIFYDDCPSMSPSQFRAICRRLYQQHNVRIIFVDYLQRLKSDNLEKVKRRQEEIAEITWTMKSCTMDLKIPIVALAQLNRKAEEHDEPELHHLREAGDIEQDADNVFLLHRSQEQTPLQHQNFEFPTMMKIAKQRNGACGIATKLILEGRFCRFTQAR